MNLVLGTGGKGENDFLSLTGSTNKELKPPRDVVVITTRVGRLLLIITVHCTLVFKKRKQKLVKLDEGKAGGGLEGISLIT